jgi:hypothetical protein
MEVSNPTVWYNSVKLFIDPHISKQFFSYPGFEETKFLHSFFSYNLSFVDRSKQLNFLVKNVIDPICEIPTMQKIDLSYEEICLNRAKYFMNLSERTNRKIFLMYSGGIDSTAILTALIRTSTPKQLRDNVIIALSSASVEENSTFFENYIFGKFECVSSHSYTQFLGNPNFIFITGEANDQLFGSAVTKVVINSFGEKFIHEYPSESNINKCFGINNTDKNLSYRIYNILQKNIDNASVEIDTVFKYFWWLNFTLKMQSVYFRILAFTLPKYKDTLVCEDNFFAFFLTKEFQLWSLNNSNSLIKDDWSSYKYVCKEFIYTLNKDENYLKYKLKKGSLGVVLRNQQISTCIDINHKNHYSIEPHIQWDFNNSFIV